MTPKSFKKALDEELDTIHRQGLYRIKCIYVNQEGASHIRTLEGENKIFSYNNIAVWEVVTKGHPYFRLLLER